MLRLESENEVFEGRVGSREKGTSESEGEIGTAESEVSEMKGDEKRHRITETTEAEKVSKMRCFVFHTIDRHFAMKDEALQVWK